jgi:hypothetical protein
MYYCSYKNNESLLKDLAKIFEKNFFVTKAKMTQPTFKPTPPDYSRANFTENEKFSNLPQTLSPSSPTLGTPPRPLFR